MGLNTFLIRPKVFTLCNINKFIYTLTLITNFKGNETFSLIIINFIKRQKNKYINIWS